MDIPSVCPYCDSEHVSYTYRPAADADATGTLVFSCTRCGSHVESPVTTFEPRRDDPRWVESAIPTQRLHQDVNSTTSGDAA